MPWKSYNIKNGRVRFYSRSTDAPYFLELPFRGNITAPVDRPRPPETIVTDRGRITADMHYVLGADTPIMDPLPMTLNFRLGNSEPNYSKFLTIIRGPASSATGTTRPTKTIGGRTWTSTKGSTQVRSAPADGTASELHTTPDFIDKEKWCVNIEALWEDPDNAADQGFQWNEVYLPLNRQLTEGENDVMVSLDGEIYGSITTITAFTAGTES